MRTVLARRPVSGELCQQPVPHHGQGDRAAHRRDGHRALVSEQDFTIMVTNVNEGPEVTMNRLQPEVGSPITAMLSDPDGGIDTDGTVGDGKDQVTLGWRWYTSKVQDPVARVDSHWAVATGEGSDTATYTPAGSAC